MWDAAPAGGNWTERATTMRAHRWCLFVEGIELDSASNRLAAGYALAAMGEGKFYANWQPPRIEDALTALVFGFMRHAPSEICLDPWLSTILRRPITTHGLELSDFWPQFDSSFEAQDRTEPDLVFDASDGEPLVVVVECKPGYRMHNVEQLVRETVDVGKSEPTRRLALIAVGADVSPHAELQNWQLAVRSGLDDQGLGDMAVEVRHASWASLGDHVEKAATSEPIFARYASDLLQQLRLNALLGYKGAPLLDDLTEMNLSNAVIAFNRLIASARQFFLTLHDQPSFRETGLRPLGRSHQMRRNGASTAVAQPEEQFQVDTLMGNYRCEHWDPDFGAFVTFYFPKGEQPLIQAGIFVSPEPENLVWSYTFTDGEEDIDDPRLSGLDQSEFPWQAAADLVQVVYAERPWSGSGGDADVAWTAAKLSVLSKALNG